MNKRIYAPFIAMAVALLAATLMSFAGGRQHASAQEALNAKLAANSSTSAPPADPLTILPASDAVVTVDVKRLLNEAMPRALAGNAAKQAEINAEIDRFKTRTGVDIRSINNVAAGVKFTDAGGDANSPTKGEIVTIANGTFNAGAIVAAGRLAAKGKYQEQKHGGKTIYVFTLNERMKLLGLFNMRLTEVAVATLDANTLAIGKLSRVREAIDSSAGRGRINAELVQMATRNANALISFGANVPAALTRNVNQVGIDNDEITKNLASIRQVYGSIGTTANGFDMLAVARTENAEQAQSLSDTVAAAKEFAGMLVSQVSRSEAKGKLLRNALENLKVAATGNEVQLRIELPLADITALVGGLLFFSVFKLKRA